MSREKLAQSPEQDMERLARHLLDQMVEILLAALTPEQRQGLAPELVEIIHREKPQLTISLADMQVLHSKLLQVATPEQLKARDPLYVMPGVAKRMKELTPEQRQMLDQLMSPKGD